MNNLKYLINQQTGIAKWKSYDSTVSRLACHKNDEYRWIFPDLAWEGTADTPIFACKFAQVKGYEQILALANEDGRIAIYNTETKGPRLGGSAHNNAIFDLAWMPKKMKLVSASGDHTAALFNVENGEIEQEQIFQGHSRSLKTVACRVNDFSVFATGARDGKIIVWDSRVAKSDILYCAPDICLPYTHYHPCQIKKVRNKSGKIQPVISGSSSVTGLVFQDYYTLISCGAGDGFIKIWDMRKNYYISERAAIPKYSIPYSGSTLRNGFSHLLLNSNGTRLYASCLDNTIYCYNVATYNPEPVMKYIGHKNSTFYVKSSLSNDETYLLSGSSDNNAYIWNTAYEEPICKLEGHEAEVTCVAWCAKRSETVLVTCSDDLKHKLWRIAPELLPKDSDEYVSRAVALTKCKSQKRKCSDENDENVHPHEISRLNAEKFRPADFRNMSNDRKKSYIDEVIMIMRNNGLREEDKEKAKKIKLETSRKRKYLNHIDTNVPCNSSSSDEDEIIEHSFKNMRLERNESSSENPLTSNLPNFVADGSAPHIINSPLKKPELDWLTKLRKERLSTSEMQELSKPSSPKMQKVDIKSPARKLTPRIDDCGSHQSPILKFFKVTSTGQQYQAKSPNLSLSPKSSQSSKES